LIVLFCSNKLAFLRLRDGNCEDLQLPR